MTNSSAPLVSIITSYYNDQEFLADAISSVLAQTYTNFEYILVNHASTDNSRQIAHSFHDARIKHIDLPRNYGASGNILIKKAMEKASSQGQYIKLLCADDYLLPDSLEKLVAAAQQTNADLVFGNIAFVSKNRDLLNKTWFTHRFPANKPTAVYVKELLQGNSCLPYAGNLIKRTAFEKIPLDYICVNIADMSLWACLLLQGASLNFVEDTVCQYRIHSGNLCSFRKKKVIEKRNLFEHVLFIKQCIRTASSVAILKQLFPKDPFTQQLQDEDGCLVPFVLARILHEQADLPAFRYAARLAIAEILNDYALQQKIEEKFDYSLRDFRQQLIAEPYQILPFYGKNRDIKTAGLGSLSYFFFRKILYILTLHDYKEKKKHAPDPKKQSSNVV